ncbi:MAG TPA: hypothetical protein VMS22_03005 [Candidatus Eisenbacteria bacterium]|nr:hypothetical protein [Candidatus Eisenbacteria bacterium]
MPREIAATAAWAAKYWDSPAPKKKVSATPHPALKPVSPSGIVIGVDVTGPTSGSWDPTSPTPMAHISYGSAMT